MPPVVIPALVPSLDKSLTEDKSLCPLRALRYYVDRTKDLRKGKALVFVSFREEFPERYCPFHYLFLDQTNSATMLSTFR